jgi:hypothetical protein
MPRGPKGERRPADVIGAAVMIGACGKSVTDLCKPFVSFSQDHWSVL